MYLTDKKTRPVVLIAPLADSLIKKLSAEAPDKYFYCQPSKLVPLSLTRNEYVHKLLEFVDSLRLVSILIYHVIHDVAVPIFVALFPSC